MIEKIESENVVKLVNHWIRSSDRDFNTMNNLYKSRDYSWSLFIGHLVIEKLLKAYFVQANLEYPPFARNLLRLAKDSKIDI